MQEIKIHIFRKHRSTSLKLATAPFYLMAAQCIEYTADDFPVLKRQQEDVVFGASFG